MMINEIISNLQVCVKKPLKETRVWVTSNRTKNIARGSVLSTYPALLFWHGVVLHATASTEIIY